jgi:NAD+ kinase
MRVLVVCKHAENSKEAQILNDAMNNGFEIIYSWKNTLSPGELKNIDLVVSIGGDGTALSASHFLVDKPILAVNSDPEKSEGALTTLTIDDLERKLDEIKSNKFKVEKLERIEVEINGKLQNPLALNEIFIANERAYLVSKYKIKLKHEGKIVEEEQKSSGLIFSTGTGSTAWFKSAGGEPFSAQARYIEMLVREPYIRKLNKFGVLKSKINETDFAEIIPGTEMVLAIDSIREFKVNNKDRIKIKISNKPLLRII